MAAGKSEQGQEQAREDPVTMGISSRSFHVGLPGLFHSILYAYPRSCNELASPRYPRKNGTMIRAGKYIHQ